MKSYNETLNFLFSRLPMFQRTGKAAYKANLDNTIAICNILDNPQNDFPSVHIAGTNGKGSVSHIIAAILQSAGYKTGLFTSPHLKDFRERIKINGKMIPEKYVVEFVNGNVNRFKNISPSFFEYTFGMAMKFFSDEKIDIAVIETGMGGRLDSTNIIRPVISVITNIGLDHTMFLGDTIQKIAAEKAGIIKENIPVVIGETQPQTKDIFLQAAEKKGSDIYFAGQNFIISNWQNTNGTAPEVLFEITGFETNEVFKLSSGLTGDYQRKNFITAFQTVKLLSRKFNIEESHIITGYKDVIKLTGISGRWQVLSHKPLVICDTGHNVDGIKEIVKQINGIPHKKLHIVFGTVNDKDTGSILSLLPGNATYYFCNAKVPRALNADILKEKARTYHLPGNSFASVKSAFDSALSNANDKDLIFVGGSTFVVAEILQTT